MKVEQEIKNIKKQQDSLMKQKLKYKEVIKELDELKNQYQNEPNVNKKQELRKKIDEKILEIFEKRLSEISDIKRKEEMAKQLPKQEQRDEYIKKEKDKLFKKLGFDLEKAKADLIDYTKGRKVKDFFLWNIYFAEVFAEKDGFDIVIGNPPYVRQEKIKSIKPLIERQNYTVYTSTADIYVYFYEKGYQLLRDGGILSFISSNKWMRAKYGESLRKFLKNNTVVLKIIDFSGYRVFKQTVDTNIILFRKEKPAKEHSVNFIEIKSDIKNVIEYVNQNLQPIPQEKLYYNTWTLADEKVLVIKEKIERIGKPLKEWDVKIYRGILTGFNEAFIIDSETKEKLCKEDLKSAEIIKPILRGRDIYRYGYKWAGLWVIVVKFGFWKQLDDYPAIKKHLMRYEKQLKNRGQCRYSRGGETNTNKGYTGQHHWLELDNNPKDIYLSEFEKEKIVWQRVTKQFSFCLVPKSLYILDSMAFMIGENLHYLLGILNSKLIDFYVKSYVHLYGDTGFLLSNQYVERIPIPPITPQNQPIANQIIALVDQILSAKTPNPDADTSELEKEIDLLVYKLYNLTEEEIKIVEGSEKNERKE